MGPIDPPIGRFVAATPDAELFVEPSDEARRLLRWFPSLTSPADGRGPLGARVLRSMLVAPFTQLTFVSFDLQMFLFDVFHRTLVARLGHFLGMVSATLFFLALLAWVSPALSILGALGLLAWYAVVAAAARLPLWWLVMVPVMAAMAALAMALGSAWGPAALGAGWMASGFAIALSHAPEPLFPPRAGHPQRWMTIGQFVRGDGGSLAAAAFRLVRVGAFVLIGTVDELWAALRLLPYNVLRLMLAFGYAPALRQELDHRAARAIASGNPALDYVGVGGGTFLAP